MYLLTGIKGKQVKYTGMIDVFNHTVQLNGLTGLWRGLTVNLIKVPLTKYLFILLTKTMKLERMQLFLFCLFDLTPSDKLASILSIEFYRLEMETSWNSKWVEVPENKG